LDFTDKRLTVWERKSIALAQRVSEKPIDAPSEKMARMWIMGKWRQSWRMFGSWGLLQCDVDRVGRKSL